MSFDQEKFAEHLKANALGGYGQGKCAKYVRRALQAAGAKIPQPYEGSGKDYGPVLLQLGFHEITVEKPETFGFLKGDVMVMQLHDGGGAHGHVAGFDGKNWISDHVQNDFWAGPGYRKKRPSYAVYRY